MHTKINAFGIVCDGSDATACACCAGVQRSYAQLHVSVGFAAMVEPARLGAGHDDASDADELVAGV
ncbi:MAG: hypothetical protein ABIY55_04835 [Kofleriaceae bacterium]